MNINNENFLAIDADGIPILNHFKIRYQTENQ